MRLRSGRIVHMEDEVSNANGGSSTNDSALVVAQPSDITSHSKGVVVSEKESHHVLVNLLTQQMTTILNPMMADHETKFDRLARQVERIARIVDYDEDQRQNTRENYEGFKNLFQVENDALRSRENPQLITRGQNADDVLARLRANQIGEHYQVTRIVEDVLNRVGFNIKFMNRHHFVSVFFHNVQMAKVPRRVKNPKIVTKFARERSKLDRTIQFKEQKGRVLEALKEMLLHPWVVLKFWVCSGFKIVRNSKTGMPSIDVIHSGTIEDLLEVLILISVAEPEEIRREQEEMDARYQRCLKLLKKLLRRKKLIWTHSCQNRTGDRTGQVKTHIQLFSYEVDI
ncbi:hypothetical protein Ahy_A09g044649 [Arachis hypogaea]|uniref:Uncharacterized protein n=1 Tax=Arachis hypogaea TaxID=3818 RepID=A0A445BKG4_ARAHY|nr:hypothetical protein Ahy_A09g044649 [Arachis hypogaea]